MISTALLVSIVSLTAINAFRSLSSSSALRRPTTVMMISLDSKAFTPTSCNWDWADEVYLITTTLSAGRLESTKEELSRVGLWDRVQVRTFQPDNEDRVRGCYTSHIKVIQEIQKKMGKRANYRAIILEDNLETTQRMSPEIITSVAKYLDKQPDWDVFHLAYMMYVPGLSLKKLPSEASIVQMLADASSSVGTSAYVISKSGVEAILQNDKSNGYVEAIPNVMARLFPRTRYAAYPMVFHRAASIGSLVNPQLDDFRKIMFSPAMYTTWEKLMVSTGLQNNQLFPGLSLTLLLSLIAGVFNVFTHSNEDLNSSSTVVSAVFLAIPLLVAAWGASLFTSDKGFAKKKA